MIFLKFLDDFKEVDRKNCVVDINYVINTDNVYDIPEIDKLRKKYNLGESELILTLMPRGSHGGVRYDGFA